MTRRERESCINLLKNREFLQIHLNPSNVGGYVASPFYRRIEGEKAKKL